MPGPLLISYRILPKDVKVNFVIMGFQKGEILKRLELMLVTNSNCSFQTKKSKKGEIYSELRKFDVLICRYDFFAKKRNCILDFLKSNQKNHLMLIFLNEIQAKQFNAKSIHYNITKSLFDSKKFIEV